MADAKWIKITTDIFDDEKILLIETLPDKDSIIVIWFKLLCMAGKQNNSGVFMMNDKMAFTDKMLSAIFRRNENTVKLAIDTFEKFGMIEIVDDVITIPNWGKHQNFDKIEQKNEYMRTYMKNYREKQKKIACKTNSKTNSKTNVSEAEEELYKEELYKKDNTKDYAEQTKQEYPFSEIIDYLNQKANTGYKHSTQKTRVSIKARMNEGFTLDDFKTVIDKKCSQWLSDEKMICYLRPETLFGTKFESYLNEKVKGGSNGNKYGEVSGEPKIESKSIQELMRERGIVKEFTGF